MLVGKEEPAKTQSEIHPPPAYTELASETPSSSTALLAPSTFIGPQQHTLSQEQHAHHYGPTPIGAYYPNSVQQPVDGSTVEITVGLLPYYDPRSSHAIEEARRRGMKRFFGALLCAIVICLVPAMIGITDRTH